MAVNPLSQVQIANKTLQLQSSAKDSISDGGVANQDQNIQADKIRVEKLINPSTRDKALQSIAQNNQQKKVYRQQRRQDVLQGPASNSSLARRESFGSKTAFLTGSRDGRATGGKQSDLLGAGGKTSGSSSESAQRNTSTGLSFGDGRKIARTASDPKSGPQRQVLTLGDKGSAAGSKIIQSASTASGSNPAVSAQITKSDGVNMSTGLGASNTSRASAMSSSNPSLTKDQSSQAQSSAFSVRAKGIAGGVTVGAQTKDISPLAKVISVKGRMSATSSSGPDVQIFKSKASPLTQGQAIRGVDAGLVNKAKNQLEQEKNAAANMDTSASGIAANPTAQAPQMAAPTTQVTPSPHMPPNVAELASKILVAHNQMGKDMVQIHVNDQLLSGTEIRLTKTNGGGLQVEINTTSQASYDLVSHQVQNLQSFLGQNTSTPVEVSLAYQGTDSGNQDGRSSQQYMAEDQVVEDAMNKS